MRISRFKVILFAVLAGIAIALGGASTASAAPAVPAVLAVHAAQAAPDYPGNGYRYYEAYGYINAHKSSAFIQLHATNKESTYQIWINGTPSCPVYNGATRTWCGFSGNGTNTLTAGVNYTVAGISYWLRIDIHSYSTGTVCDVRGNGDERVITYC
jgi:hypothetical protein